MGHKRVAGFALIAVLMGSTSYADPVVVTFDERSPGVHGGFDYLPFGLFLSSFACGVAFSCDSLTIDASTNVFRIDTVASATTAPNAAFGRDGFHRNFEGLFFDPSTGPPVGGAATTFLSFSVVNTSPNQNALWRAAIYGWNHELLDERTGQLDQQVVFSLPSGGIRSFRLFAPTGQQAGIDTLSFNPPVVPEPATFLLVGSGLALAATRRLRGRTSRSREHR
jgi:hypothetical protein